jgi:transposase
MQGNVLTSWKEIAQHFGKGVRTVQRWEKELGLPVQRTKTGKKGIVLAFPNDLDNWVRRHTNSSQQTFELKTAAGLTNAAPESGQ